MRERSLFRQILVQLVGEHGARRSEQGGRLEAKNKELLDHNEVRESIIDF